MVKSRLLLGAVVAMVCALAGSALPQEAMSEAQTEGPATTGQQKQYDPPKTTVAVAALANAAGGGQAQRDACQAATDRIRAAFASRGFQVLDSKAVADTLKKAGIDFADAEDRRKEMFQRIGGQLGADLVVGGVLLYYKRHGHGETYSRIELKVYDTHEKVYRVRALQAGSSESARLAPEAEGLRRRSLGHAIDKVLQDFLKPYPVIKEEGGGASSG